MNAQITTYLNWLRERGLESFDPVEIQINEYEDPKKPDGSSVETSPSHSVDMYIGDHPKVMIFLHNRSSSLKAMNKEEKLLLANLLKAMKLSFSTIVLVSLCELESLNVNDEIRKLAHQYSMKKVLMMGSHFKQILPSCPFGDMGKLDEIDVLTTYSVHELHEDQSLKREAWGHLQKF